MFIIKDILDDNWSGIKEYSEKLTAEIIKRKIDDAKLEVLADINGVDKEQMEDIVNVSS